MQTSFGPEVLLIFIGHSGDADLEAHGLMTLESRLQRELDKLLAVKSEPPSFRRVRLWEWNYHASAQTGGQDRVVTPALLQAEIAVFVFKERIGPVTWSELELSRNSNKRVIAAFPNDPPGSDRMKEPQVVRDWHELLVKKQTLTSDWTDVESGSVTPIQDYADVENLKEIIFARIALAMTELLAPAAESLPANQRPKAILDEEQLRVAYENTNRASHPCPGATADDVDIELIEQYAKSTDLSDVSDHGKQIAGLGLLSPLDEKYLHTAAVLCFCRAPETYFPQARACLVVGDPVDTEFLREDITGPLSRQVERLEELIVRNLGKVARFTEGGLRMETREIPKELIREIVSNAVVHRDYRAGGVVQVFLTDEHLEVRSPGCFPAGTSWQSLTRGHPSSNPVDPRVAWYLTKLLAFEGVGRGTGVFQEYIRKNGRKSLTCVELKSPPMVIIRANRPKWKLKSNGPPFGLRDWFAWLFRPRGRSLQCPFCMSVARVKTQTRSCPSCGMDFPSHYLSQLLPLVSLFVVGWSYVGKTTFLQSLILSLQRLPHVWPHFSLVGCTESAMQLSRAAGASFSDGILPPATALGVQEPYVFLMRGLDFWGDRTLVVGDYAGENFESFDFHKETLPTIGRSRAVLMMISLSDLEKTPGRSMDELMTSYSNALLDAGHDLRRQRRKIVVVLSKADAIRDLPLELREYLAADPFAQRGDSDGETVKPADYLERMAEISDTISEWLQGTEQGMRFIRLAKDLQIELRFTLVSSLGCTPDEGNRVTHFQPHRVLDPLFWILQLLSAGPTN